MKRIFAVLAVGVLMAVMLVALAAPAFAAKPDYHPGICHADYREFGITGKVTADSCRPRHNI